MAGKLDVKPVESRLLEYQAKAKEMSVGVNYAALHSERQRQENLLRELRELEKEISSPQLNKTQLPQLASDVGVDLDLSAKCLKYLMDISELERSVATLTDNVDSCWDYVDQLASLVQIHLKSAAQYHQFFHEANEIESKMERQVTIAKDRQALSPGRRIYKETSRLANEIREQLDVMRSLWDRSRALVERSSRIVPMRLRLGGVAKGRTVGSTRSTERPVMVRAMTCLIGPNYNIQQGEHLRLIDNREDVQLWKVQTPSGIAEVPSICFWLTGNDPEAINRAIAIKKKCRNVWLDLLERDRQLLYDNFTEIMKQLASEEHLYCTNYDVLNGLLQDMRILLPNSGQNDGRLHAAVDKFQRKVIVKNAMERIPTTGVILKELDLVRMRAPLLRLQDHLDAIRKTKSDDERIANYLNEVESEREQVYNSIGLLESLMEKSQTQLKDMMDELDQWRRSAPVQDMRAKYIRAPKDKRHMKYYSGLTESPQSSLVHFRSRSQPAMAQESPRGRHKSLSTSKYSDPGQTNTFKRSKSTQLSLDWPTQLSVMTQIGCESKEVGNQVDNVEVQTLDAESNAYIRPEDANLQHYMHTGKKNVNCASQCHLVNANSRTPVQQVNVCTQQGVVRRNQACSPTRDPPGDCPLCHRPTQLEIGRIQRYPGGDYYYDAADPFYSATEIQSMSEFYQISEEPPVPFSDVLVCKRLQVGYPSLNPKRNLYTQVDVYKNAEDIEVGDTVRPGEKIGMETLHKPCDRTETVTQTGVIQKHRASSPHCGFLTNRILSESHVEEHASMISADVDTLVTQPGKRTMRTQAGYPTLTSQTSASTMIFKRVIQKHRASNPHCESLPDRMLSESYVVEHASMISADVDTLVTQPGKRTMRTQAGYPKLTIQSSASTMMFKPIPKRADTSIQNEPILTENVAQTTEPIRYATPVRQNDLVSKRTQMGFPRCGPLRNSFVQVGRIYNQSEVQTSPTNQTPIQPTSQPLVQAPLPADAGHAAEMLERSTQVSKMVTHERLSPIIPEFSTESKRTQVGEPRTHSKIHSWLQCSVAVSDKSSLTDAVVSKTETVKSNAVQTLQVHAAPEAVVRPIKTMKGEAAMQELPEMVSTGAQVVLVAHGKKLEVSVEPAQSEMAVHLPKGHSKKFQVSLELRREQFDVSCEAILKPETFSKKIQPEELEPPVLVQTRQDPVFAPAPSPAAPLMQEAGCEYKPVMQDSSCLAKLVPLIYDGSAQIIPIPPPAEKTHGKKLQVGLIVTPESTQMVSTLMKTTHPSAPDSAADPCPRKESFDVGIQISTPVPDVVRAEAVPVVHAAPPAPMVEYADTGCDVVSGPTLNDAFVQAESVVEVKVPTFGKKLQVSIVSNGVEAATQSDTGRQIDPEISPVVRAAPPVSAYEAYALVEQLHTSTCQTDMVAEPPKPQLVFIGSQCAMPNLSNIDIEISTPEPDVVRAVATSLVYSALLESTIEYVDTGCNVFSGPTLKDAFVQADPVAELKAPTFCMKQLHIEGCQTEVRSGVEAAIQSDMLQVEPEARAAGVRKKLQVRLPQLVTSTCQTDMVAEPQKQTPFSRAQIDAAAEPASEIVPLVAPVVKSAPRLPAEESEDRAGDAIYGAQYCDAFTQTVPCSTGRNAPTTRPTYVFLAAQCLNIGTSDPTATSKTHKHPVNSPAFGKTQKMAPMYAVPSTKPSTDFRYGEKPQVPPEALYPTPCPTMPFGHFESRPRLQNDSYPEPKFFHAGAAPVVPVVSAESVPVIAPAVAPIVKSVFPIPAADDEERGVDTITHPPYSDVFAQSTPTVGSMPTSTCQGVSIPEPTCVYLTAQCVNIATPEHADPSKTLYYPVDFTAFGKTQTMAQMYAVPSTQAETDIKHGEELEVPTEPQYFTAFMTRPFDHLNSRSRLRNDSAFEPEVARAEAVPLVPKVSAESALVIAPVVAPIVKSLSPLPAAINEGRAADAISGPQYSDEFARSTLTIRPMPTSAYQSVSIPEPTCVYLTAQCVNIGTPELTETSETVNNPVDFPAFGRTQKMTPMYAIPSTNLATDYRYREKPQVPPEALYPTPCPTMPFGHGESRPRLQNDSTPEPEFFHAGAAPVLPGVSAESVPVIVPAVAPIVKSVFPLPAADTEGRTGDTISGPQYSDAFARSTPTIRLRLNSTCQGVSIPEPTCVYLTAQCVNIGTSDTSDPSATSSTPRYPVDFPAFGKIQTMTPVYAVPSKQAATGIQYGERPQVSTEPLYFTACLSRPFDNVDSIPRLQNESATEPEFFYASATPVVPAVSVESVAVIAPVVTPIVKSVFPMPAADMEGRAGDAISGPRYSDVFAWPTPTFRPMPNSTRRGVPIPQPTCVYLAAQCVNISTSDPSTTSKALKHPVDFPASGKRLTGIAVDDGASDAATMTSGYEAFAQVEPEAKASGVGKKLQVRFPKLVMSTCQTNMVAEPPKPQLVFIGSQCAMPNLSNIGIQISTPVPDVVRAEAVPVVHAAPPAPMVEYADTGCDVVSGPTLNDAFVQAESVVEVKVPTFGKKLQVSIVSNGVEAATQSDTGRQIDPEISPVVRATPPVSAVETSDRACDAIPMAIAYEAYALVEQLHTSTCQTDMVAEPPKPQLVFIGSQCAMPNLSNIDIQISTPEPDVVRAVATSLVHSALLESTVEYADTGCDVISWPEADPLAEVKAPTFGKKLQVCLPQLHIQRCQAAVNLQAPIYFPSAETGPIAEAAPVITPLLASDVKSAPPLPSAVYEDRGGDAISGPQHCDAFTQSDPALLPMPSSSSRNGTKLSVPPELLHFISCQTTLLSYVDSRPRLQNDMLVQVELPAKRPPCRGVRIQAGLPTAAPKVQVQTRNKYVQSTPLVIVGTTQTFHVEGTPAIKAVKQTTVKTAQPTKPIDDDNTFEFARETVARVTRSSSRKSLIPVKTQFLPSGKQMSASMPANLNVLVNERSNISTTGPLTYQRVPNMPRHYATRLRSASSSRNFFIRRNRSAENIDGYKQRFPTKLEGFVRQLGYEKVHRILVDVGLALELEELEYNSHVDHSCIKRPRLQEARPQYTSTTSLMNVYPGYYYHYTPSAFPERHYKSNKSVQEGISFVRWTPLAPGQQVSIVYQSELSATKENLPCFGVEGADSPGKKLVGWVRRVGPLTEPEAIRPPRQETASSKQFLKSPALAAYCSDAELQGSGIKTNYSAYNACTLVSWQANDRGDGRLETSTLGRLLKLTLVGARLPGSGEIIAAADAFYRGILRIVYFDEESSTMLSLPAAINTGHVIVEKQYLPGVGIALCGDQDGYPVESEVVWTTPELRHRSYKVNYIRKSETEKINVLTALDEGVIDQYTGEIVNITLGPTTSMGQPIHEARESSVGTGDTMQRRQKPQRFNINEAILNDILNVEFDGQETIASLAPEGIQDSNSSKSGSGEPLEVDI